MPSLQELTSMARHVATMMPTQDCGRARPRRYDPLFSDEIARGRARKGGGHAPKAGGAGARVLALGDYYGQKTCDDFCFAFAVETDESGILAAAERQPENLSHRSARPGEPTISHCDRVCASLFERADCCRWMHLVR